MRLISITEEDYSSLFYDMAFLNALILKGVEEWEGFEDAVKSCKEYIESDEFKEDYRKDIKFINVPPKETIEVKEINE